MAQDRTEDDARLIDLLLHHFSHDELERRIKKFHEVTPEPFKSVFADFERALARRREMQQRDA